MNIYISLISNKKRKAIAMVELIFAIVVIGITLLSVPLMVNQASESTYTTLQQEAIAAAASDMSLILSRAWDENNTEDKLYSSILTTDSDNYIQTSRTNLRSRTYYISTGGRLAATSIGAEGDSDDIDDVNGDTDTPLTTMDVSDLIDSNMRISRTVSYLNDGLTSPIGTTPTTGVTSNIKGITITLTSGSITTPELNKTIVLNAFSSNIGSYQLQREVF